MRWAALVLALVPVGVFAQNEAPAASEIYEMADEINYHPPKPIDVRARGRCPRSLTWVRGEQQSVDTVATLPKLRCFAPYPRKCLSVDGSHHAVDLIFDVTPRGLPQNIRISRATNKCFEKEAAKALSRSRFPETANGNTNLEMSMTFHLE